MAGHECYHCRQWVEAGEPHDCWTTTESALTQDLTDDLRDAWERLRDTAAEFGEQRIYASHKSIMFSRQSCYFYVRPKKSFLEVNVFLGRPLRAPQVRRVSPSSSTKFLHVLQVRHRDEVEAPITDWLREAYEHSDTLTRAAKSTAKPAPKKKPALKKAASRAKAGRKKTPVRAAKGGRKKR